jgi:RNA polymerase sigma-70 factor (ECF subfamily)
MDPKANPGSRDFRTTHWSLVADAADSRAPGAESALAELCRSYWSPLYVFVRSLGTHPDESLDLVQGFFAYFLENRLYAGADRSRGRFRTFLMSSMRNFRTNQWRHANRQKRGGGMETVPLDLESTEEACRAELTQQAAPETLFDRRWAKAVLSRVLRRLEEEFQEADQADRFAVFKPLLGGEPPGTTMEAAAEALGLTPGAFRTALHRFRQRYRELFREEVASQVHDPRDVDDEIRHLIAALGREPG